jgi:hypothetical protein
VRAQPQQLPEQRRLRGHERVPAQLRRRDVVRCGLPDEKEHGRVPRSRTRPFNGYQAGAPELYGPNHLLGRQVPGRFIQFL